MNAALIVPGELLLAGGVLVAPAAPASARAEQVELDVAEGTPTHVDGAPASQVTFALRRQP